MIVWENVIKHQYVFFVAKPYNFKKMIFENLLHKCKIKKYIDLFIFVIYLTIKVDKSAQIFSFCLASIVNGNDLEVLV